jgi:predicted nucleic acid-binding protein
MSQKVAVKDANVFIDMEVMGILDLWFQLGIETITSSLVVQELEDGRHLQALAYVDSEQIAALSSPLQAVFALREKHTGISVTDASVLHLAIEHDALLLTGDQKLRTVAEARAVECHGSIWVLDQLVIAKKLLGSVAAEKLSALLALTGKRKRFLPRESAEEHISRWRRM